MTTNIQLNQALSKYRKKGFLGVYANDTTPKSIRFGEAFITNLEPTTKGGSHWVCVLGGAINGMNLYVDSYGFHSPDSFMSMLKNESGYFKFSTSQYQSIDSIKCGEFCCYFIAKFLDGRNIYDLFYKDLEPGRYVKNDQIVSSFFKTL